MINVPPPKTLLIGTWNMNGFRSKVFGNKFEQQDVRNMLLALLKPTHPMT